MQVRSHSKCRKRSVYMPSHSPAKKTEPVHIFFSNQAAAKLMLHIQCYIQHACSSKQNDIYFINIKQMSLAI